MPLFGAWWRDDWSMASTESDQTRRIAGEMEEALQASERDHPTGIPEPDVENQFMLLTYGRAVSLFKSILVLVLAGIPYEALILGRPLFEDSLRLHHLSQVPAGARAGLTGSAVLSQLRRDIGICRAANAALSGHARLVEEAEQYAEFYSIYMTNRGIVPRRTPDDTALVQMYATPFLKFAWLSAQEEVHGGNAFYGKHNVVDAEGRLHCTAHPDPILTGFPGGFAIRSLGIGRPEAR
jgi:hypothetical protein